MSEDRTYAPSLTSPITSAWKHHPELRQAAKDAAIIFGGGYAAYKVTNPGFRRRAGRLIFAATRPFKYRRVLRGKRIALAQLMSSRGAKVEFVPGRRGFLGLGRRHVGIRFKSRAPGESKTGPTFQRWHAERVRKYRQPLPKGGYWERGKTNTNRAYWRSLPGIEKFVAGFPEGSEQGWSTGRRLRRQARIEFLNPQARKLHWKRVEAERKKNLAELGRLFQASGGGLMPRIRKPPPPGWIGFAKGMRESKDMRWARRAYTSREIRAAKRGAMQAMRRVGAPFRKPPKPPKTPTANLKPPPVPTPAPPDLTMSAAEETALRREREIRNAQYTMRHSKADKAAKKAARLKKQKAMDKAARRMARQEEREEF